LRTIETYGKGENWWEGVNDSRVKRTEKMLTSIVQALKPSDLKNIGGKRNSYIHAELDAG